MAGEIFSGECFEPIRCGDCLIAAYIEEGDLGEREQSELVNVAVSAQRLFLAGIGRDETIQQIARHPSSGGMALEAIQTAVDGVIMWYKEACYKRRANQLRRR